MTEMKSYSQAVTGVSTVVCVCVCVYTRVCDAVSLRGG